MTIPVQDIEAVSEEIVQEFAFFDDWMGRYEHLIEMGRVLGDFPDNLRKDEFRIRGCQAQVWLIPELQNGRVRFLADSDAMITKGLIGLLVRVLDGRLPGEIMHADLSFLDRIGMKEHLSPTRKNGLDAMIKQIRLYAIGLDSEGTHGD